MQTLDGLTWTLETAAVESRHHPITSITYHYQVEGAEGQLLRREWTLVPRTYFFDHSKHYLFSDQWRDRPLAFHLYSNAYLTTRHLPHGEQAKPLRVPLYRKTLLFRVSAPQVEAPQAVAIVGSHPAMGSWSPAKYLPMEYVGQHDWLLSVNADAIALPLEYKYVVIDKTTNQLVSWEEGDNRIVHNHIADGQVHVHYGETLRLREHTWRLAGVVVPVFSLRSQHSYGVGDFGDLRRFVDWAVATGMKVIQTLPVNDTTTDGHWHDSHPYNITCCMALHPHYLDLEQLGQLSDKHKMTAYHRKQRELNALPYSDYEAVDSVKRQYVADIFDEHGKDTLDTSHFKAWKEANNHWLKPYTEWLCTHTPNLTADQQQRQTTLTIYTQYNLHLQLKAAADYARSKGVVLKGDMPIGINRHSVETTLLPHLFNLDSQTGAPPDAHSPQGQNWGFPTYNWEAADTSATHTNTPPTVTQWLRSRYQWMEQYFDAVRIDHVLAYFRVWEIPYTALSPQLGHFSPALPMTPGEITHFGLPFRRQLLTQPFINDTILQNLFGIHTQYVCQQFLDPKPYGLYQVKPHLDNQRKIEAHFHGHNDENSIWIRDGMMTLLSNVLFVEDPRQPDTFHPRINAWQEPVFQALNADEKDAYMRIYNNYFQQRHNIHWGNTGSRRLNNTLSHSRLLICAEDLGLLPPCVAPVLDTLRIATLQVQTMPKQGTYEFTHLDHYPYRSVATFETHDMPPLRLWWEANPYRTQRYYTTMLQKQGHAPQQLPPHLAEEIIARHLYCPSMLCILSLQDWLAIDGTLRSNNTQQERINHPDDPYNRWQWRMHITIEQLLAAHHFNTKLKTMITRSKR